MGKRIARAGRNGNTLPQRHALTPEARPGDTISDIHSIPNTATKMVADFISTGMGAHPHEHARMCTQAGRHTRPAHTRLGVVFHGMPVGDRRRIERFGAVTRWGWGSDSGVGAEEMGHGKEMRG